MPTTSRLPSASLHTGARVDDHRIDILGETVRDLKSNVGNEASRTKYLGLFERYLASHPGGCPPRMRHRAHADKDGCTAPRSRTRT